MIKVQKEVREKSDRLLVLETQYSSLEKVIIFPYLIDMYVHNCLTNLCLCVHMCVHMTELGDNEGKPDKATQRD